LERLFRTEAATSTINNKDQNINAAIRGLGYRTLSKIPPHLP